MPRRCILEISVVLDNPSFAAAPFQPPITQLVASSVARMWSRSTSASVRDDDAGRWNSLGSSISGSFVVRNVPETT
jgi:hypothetical protein